MTYLDSEDDGKEEERGKGNSEEEDNKEGGVGVGRAGVEVTGQGWGHIQSRQKR